MKKRSLKFVIAGSILALLLLAFGVLFVTSNTQPADFRTHTGTVAEFDWHDERWYEGLLGTDGQYDVVFYKRGTPVAFPGASFVWEIGIIQSNHTTD